MLPDKKRCEKEGCEKKGQDGNALYAHGDLLGDGVIGGQGVCLQCGRSDYFRQSSIRVRCKKPDPLRIGLFVLFRVFLPFIEDAFHAAKNFLLRADMYYQGYDCDHDCGGDTDHRVYRWHLCEPVYDYSGCG